MLGVGYVPGKSATLVRNPNWNAATDYRPAYLNEIHDQDRRHQRGDRPRGAGRHEHRRERTAGAPRPSRKRLEKYKSQLEISPGAGVALHRRRQQGGACSRTINLRKALWAALDRKAMDKARGGELVTNVATHFIYPGVPGFEQAGGLAGPKGAQFDFNEHPEGDMAVAEKYMKLAGYPSGKYTGGETVTVVGSSCAAGQGRRRNRELDAEKPRLHDQVHAARNGDHVREVLQRAQRRDHVCPSVGWIADFADAQAVLNVTFNGNFITQHRERQLGPDQRPRTQLGDGRREIDQRHRSAGEGVGEDRRRNWSKTRPRSRSTGTSRRTSRARKSKASAISGTSASGTTTSRR